jgi:hypothetical protein
MNQTVNAMKIATRSIVTIIAVFSWLAISNHCALAVTASQRLVAQSECPFHSHRDSKPAGPKNSEAQPCCKILRAITAKSAKNLTPAIVDLIDVDFAVLFVFAPPRISFDSISLDTGPPGSISFAESVLQRSILAHAPPLSA